ncbi:MAG: hypothetical protein MUC42_09340 [Bryobacter sp.]|jgi:hypothetical protein|nr:hypothetical protein [Bryobacter sp.]
MAKIKAAGKGKSKSKSARSPLQALPCLILIVLGVVLLSMSFYALLRK